MGLTGTITTLSECQSVSCHTEYVGIMLKTMWTRLADSNVTSNHPVLVSSQALFVFVSICVCIHVIPLPYAEDIVFILDQCL